jgi:ATP-dependent DNA helicase RecQ
LIGKENQMLRTYHASKLEIFGAGNERDERFWTAVLRQTVFNGFLRKEVETYGLLKLTDKGKAFMKKPYEVKMVEDVDYSNTESDDDDDFMSGGGAAVDEEFFAQLKEMRKKMAKLKNVPPFVIFQDPSLEEMAIQYPITMDELQKITGVGPGKASKYGKPFLDFIKKYVEENEIERPMDFVIKSVANKSQLKVAIIKNIDRKVILDDMAKAKGIPLSELLSEIESIVASGTKVDLNYYINEIIDLERQREVYDYFRTAETDSADHALKELGEHDYSLDDIRLMRIKFMSEMAN